jgi:hypothetical protein
MTIYYFHLRDGDAFIPDETGMDLTDIREGRDEALQAARDMLADQLRAGEALDGQRIEITAADGKVLDVVSFGEALRPVGQDRLRPGLAAVVKGTRFTVDVSKGKSSVTVKRGHVEVESHLDHSSALLSVGQQAEVAADTGGSVLVSGGGKLPVVYGANGKALGVTAKGAEGCR